MPSQASPTSLFSEPSSPENDTEASLFAPATNKAPKSGSTSKVAATTKPQSQPPIMPSQRENISGGSSLSTKHRLAQIALAIEKPNSKSKPPTSSNKNRLFGLAFKKTRQESDVANRPKEVEDTRPLFQLDGSAAPDILGTMPLGEPVLGSPQLMTSLDEYVTLADYDPDFASFQLPEPEYVTDISFPAVRSDAISSMSPIQRAPSLPQVQAQPDKPTEAETFLSEIMPLE
jgi:hypothetical protein